MSFLQREELVMSLMKTFNAYCMSRLHWLIGYFMSCMLLIMYYYLESNGELIVIYPVLLSSVVFLIVIVSDFYTYYEFHKKVKQIQSHVDVPLVAVNKEQRIILESMNQMKQESLKDFLMLEKEIKEHQRLLSLWIHNMKTPVSVMKLMIQRTQMFDNLSFQNDLLLENQKLCDQLDHILTLNRIEEFQQDYEPRSLDATAIIRSLINENKQQFICHGVFPVFSLKEERLILSDEKWLRFLLNQLITNGIKYSNRGQGQQIYFDIVLDHNETVIIIQDEGIGIPKYDLKKIYEPFFTGENGRMNKHSTGIGLYICKKICDKLHHKMVIESEVSKGTTVKLTCLSKL